MVGDATGNPPRRALGRVLIVAALVALPATLAVDHVINEPYPALILPAFAETRDRYGDITTAPEPTITVGFADGGTEALEVEQLIPSGAQSSVYVFRRMFVDEVHGRDPRVTTWLDERLDTVFPGRDATRFTVVWSTRTYDVLGQTQSSAQDESVVVVRLATG